MLRKICPYCKKASYSSSEFMLLFCPHCEANLRYVEAEPATEEIVECIFCESRMAKMWNGDWVCNQCGWRYKKEESKK